MSDIKYAIETLATALNSDEPVTLRADDARIIHGLITAEQTDRSL